MQEQINIRKAELSKRLLKQKSEEEELQLLIEESQKKYEKAKENYQKYLGARYFLLS